MILILDYSSKKQYQKKENYESKQKAIANRRETAPVKRGGNWLRHSPGKSG
jgi:hypothetical protein